MLAPMAGYTDLPFRRMCKRYGAGMVFTEVVTVEGVIRYNSRTMHYLKTMPRSVPSVHRFTAPIPIRWLKPPVCSRQWAYLT